MVSATALNAICEVETMHALFPLIFTDDVSDARDFYRSLFGFEVVVDVGWYVQLAASDDDGVRVAFVESGHESVPEGFRAAPAGFAVTAEVDDVAAVHARAVELGLPVRGGPRDEEWGQRHFHGRDPAGVLVDVTQPIPPSPEFPARHGWTDSGSADA